MKNDVKYLYNNESYYVITSNQTAFEVKLLNWLDINIVRNNISFTGFAETYNSFHHSNKNFDIVSTKRYFLLREFLINICIIDTKLRQKEIVRRMVYLET